MRWSEEDLAKLKESYQSSTIEDLLVMFPDRNYSSLVHKAWCFGLKRENPWTEDEECFLRDNYGDMKPAQISAHIGRSVLAVMCHANVMGIKYDLHQRHKKYQGMRKGTLQWLLEDNLQTMYWIGFLLADGSMDANQMRVKLAIKDKDHIDKLAEKCDLISRHGTPSGKKSVNISASDPMVISAFQEKYGNWERKTYNPPEISNWDLSEDRLLAMLIGYLDGDGCISRRKEARACCIYVGCHSSWIDNMLHFCERLISISGIQCQKPYIDNKGYVRWCIGKSELCRYLKLFAIENSLPIMNRKWDRVTLDLN